MFILLNILPERHQAYYENPGEESSKFVFLWRISHTNTVLSLYDCMEDVQKCSDFCAVNFSEIHGEKKCITA